jgi:RHS repeat-associated protein
LIAEYRYDPFGRRAKKFVHIPEERVVNYLYDGAQVIEERNEDFEPERRFVYGPGIDEPVSVYDVTSGETYFYQRDGLGSVTELTDAEGNVIERYRYTPYGKLKICDGSWTQLTGSTVGNAYFFTGRRYDPESGLYYYRARMYSSEVGRFLQVDPIGYWAGINLYVTKQSYNLEDIRLLTYRQLCNMITLVLAASYFAAVYLGDRLKLAVLT